MKSGGRMGHGPKKNPFHLAGDLDKGLDPGFYFFTLIHIEFFDIFTNFPGNNAWILMKKIRHS